LFTTLQKQGEEKAAPLFRLTKLVEKKMKCPLQFDGGISILKDIKLFLTLQGKKVEILSRV
jgi:phosphoribosylformimino-5-aminoimidazole carboxamide ribonucleotide (ProFAR) isomerase